MSYRHFSQTDFDGCKPPCKIEDIHPDTLRKADAAREFAKIAFKVTSAARTLQWEISRGRPGTSSHVYNASKKCRALDIRARNSHEVYRVVLGAMMAGFNRIGVNYEKNFVHLDDDPAKPPEVLFPY